MPCPWKCSRWSWVGLWAMWSSWRCPCPSQGDQSYMIFKGALWPKTLYDSMNIKFRSVSDHLSCWLQVMHTRSSAQILFLHSVTCIFLSQKWDFFKNKFNSYRWIFFFSEFSEKKNSESTYFLCIQYLSAIY